VGRGSESNQTGFLNTKLHFQMADGQVQKVLEIGNETIDPNEPIDPLKALSAGLSTEGIKTPELPGIDLGVMPKPDGGNMPTDKPDAWKPGDINNFYWGRYGGQNSQDIFNNGKSGNGDKSADWILPKLYMHTQFGGRADYNIKASTLDFSGTSQRELKLTGMKPGDVRTISLFDSGINSRSLAFGSLRMTYQDNNQFSIESNLFDFDYQSNSSFARDAGTFIGGAVFGQFYTIPITPFSILRDVTGFGGSFMINFNGTVTIPK
jgi:hypothetical protein